ncbi:MAG: hypothetical protein GY943_14185 [Chloroflexi bacterium]|nr:hypothetical protein [Chloroflexota bacterium]
MNSKWLNILLLVLLIPACQQSHQTTFLANQLKIEISDTGFYQITLSDLQANGLTLDHLNAATLHLSTNGTAVPYHLTPNGLVFYGEAATDRYTAVSIYLIETGKAGLNIPQPSAPSTQTNTIHLEENHIYESRARTTDQDPVWFWQRLVQGNSLPISLKLDDIGDGSGTLNLYLWSANHNPNTFPDHDLTITVNGRFTTTLTWDDAIHIRKQINLPANTLINGNNQLILDNHTQNNTAPDIIYIDKVDLQFGTNDGAETAVSNPIPIQAHQLSRVRQTNLLAPTTGAQFIIITTDKLVPALQPLANHRTESGLQTTIIPITDIYDTFGFGSQTPTSIDTFIAYAATKWPRPHLQYILLVGDATTDYHQYQHPLPTAHIPSPMIPVQFSGETISDAPYADINGDGVPDLVIGRWPVSTETAVTTLVNRTIAYESKPAAQHTHFTIDNTEPTFARMTDRLLQNGILATQSHTISSNNQWHDDTWLSAYFGHGTLRGWGQTNILTTTTLPQKMPDILFQFTCLTGYFAHPTEPSLTETLLTSPNGPTITVAATSLTLSNHQEPFAHHLLTAVQDTAVTRIGDAFLQAKQQLNTTANPALQEVSDTFTLFADPTTPIMRPPN